MDRYLRIYKAFWKSSLARELEFRANFLAKIAQNVVWTGFFLVMLLVIFSKTNTIAGWSRGDSFLLAGTIFVLDAIFRGLFWSLIEIPELVRKGTLDFVVTKPVDSQFWVSTRKIGFEQLGIILAGCALVVVGCVQSQIHPSAVDVLAYLVAGAFSMAMFYAFNLLLMTLAIWFVRVDNLWVLSDTITHVARYPTDMYSIGVQKVFLYALPLSLIASVPANMLRQGASWQLLVLGLVWAIVLMVAARWLWRFALKSYGSASS